jgi:hypothetical protein
MTAKSAANRQNDNSGSEAIRHGRSTQERATEIRSRRSCRLVEMGMDVHRSTGVELLSRRRRIGTPEPGLIEMLEASTRCCASRRF